MTGQSVNRGAGYGLEIPVVYHLYGPKAYIAKILHENGLLSDTYVPRRQSRARYGTAITFIHIRMYTRT